ncbi:hypothetical protein MY4038_001737 [Beauveria bassiana]
MNSTTALLSTGCTQPNVYEKCQSISTSSSVCHFLKLPHEIVLSIIDYLQQDSKAVLYLTCSPLRNIIYHGYRLRTELRFWSNRKMAIRFLNCIGKERLDVWVCNYCLRFHQHSADSVPSAGAYPQPCCPTRGVRRYDMQTLITYQRDHILLALKYARLESSLHGPYEQHQRLLMQPHSGQVDSLDYARVTFRVVPRIVEGRFLVFREHICEYDRGPAPNLIYGLSRSCCHMRFVAADIGPWAFSNPRRFQELPHEFCLVHIVCTCRTETRIDLYGTTVRTRTWEDFGTEFSSLKSIVFYDYDACEGPERIRELYESVMDDLDSFYTPQSVLQPAHGAEPQYESQNASNQEKPRRDGKKKVREPSDKSEKSDKTEKVMEEATRWARLKGRIKMLLGFLDGFSVRHKAGTTTTTRPSTPHPAAPLQPLNLRLVPARV